MRKTVTEEVTKKVTKVVVTCDRCGRPGGSTFGVCQGCGCDCCSKCRVFWDYDPFTGSDGGDYPEFACTECTSKLGPYATAVREAMEEFDEFHDTKVQEWKDACKGVKHVAPESDA